ncbi:class I SAM-dependent methyltransferase [Radiobacillus kanasensis]|uniref:class I SAM-dependent methyltransferase n=1 Tax=Radiobacillus kanasensis TaxID=2844358 RepID=UPI001E574A7D|nr:class I SAM-dependent methyltransferase [Radiobacillus kanasensis]UFT97943.1 class I SAM-dependent methyltransferase [Radiobacillus kanasensis]
MIITTGGRSGSTIVSYAKRLAITSGIPYISRNGVSIQSLKEQYQDDIVVVGQDRIFISPLNATSNLFFHPNIAMIQAKRLSKGEEEPLITTAKLKEGMSILDCTLGLGSDSIMASLAVGPSGTVTGVEGNQLLYLLVKEGLASFSSGNDAFDQAMRRIKVVYADHFTFLSQVDTDSVDVVYFDPMFTSSIESSSGINSIRGQALTTDINQELIIEAKRVAKERVVLKDHWKSERFRELGFTQHRRKTSLFHYGTIEL